MNQQSRAAGPGRQRSERRPWRIALAGLGTVGRSVDRLLRRHAEEAELVVICNRDIARKRASRDGPDVLWTETFDEVLAQKPDLFIELIGGRSPAESWIRQALSAGVSVVTANKQVMAESGAALQALAAASGCHLRFEAAVGGGVPVIGGIESGLAGDHLTRVSGILNGTCNYILTRLESSGSAFADALREAQALGFAEANPTDDIDGVDARAKIAILALVALGVITRPTDIVCRSIADVSAVDFSYARQLGCTIRQVAWAERAAGGVLTARVGPSLVPLTSALARAQGSENLVIVSGEASGETTFGGRGAGGDPTAVAIVSDLLAIVRGGEPQPLPLRREVTPSPEFWAPFYVPFTVTDRPGIIAGLAAVFAAHQINIDAVLQEPGHPSHRRPFVVSLDACLVSAVERALAGHREVRLQCRDAVADAGPDLRRQWKRSTVMTYTAHLRCTAGCPGSYAVDEVVYRCRHCDDLLEVAHDLEALRDRSPGEWKILFDSRYKRTAWPYGSSVWGKKEWVAPSIRDGNVVSMDEGGTNLFFAERFGREIGLDNLWVKLCGNSHTGSFKDLGNDGPGVDRAPDDAGRAAGPRCRMRVDW